MFVFMQKKDVWLKFYSNSCTPFDCWSIFISKTAKCEDALPYKKHDQLIMPLSKMERQGYHGQTWRWNAKTYLNRL